MPYLGLNNKREEPLSETIVSYACLCAVLWLPVVLIWVHSTVVPLPGFGRAGMLFGAGFGVWALMGERRAVPLSVCGLLYGGLIVFVAISAPGEFFYWNKWPFALVIGEIVLLLGAVISMLKRPPRKDLKP